MEISVNPNGIDLNIEEKHYYDLALRESYIQLTNAGFEVGPDDLDKLKKGLALSLVSTREHQDETNVLEYTSQTYADHVGLNLKPPSKKFYRPGNTAPYKGQNHSKEVAAHVEHTSIVYEPGDGRVLSFFLFPVPSANSESLEFGSVVGSQESLFHRTNNEYYFGPMQQITDKDVEDIKTAIVKAGIMTRDDLDRFTAKSKIE